MDCGKLLSWHQDEKKMAALADFIISGDLKLSQNFPIDYCFLQSFKSVSFSDLLSCADGLKFSWSLFNCSPSSHFGTEDCPNCLCREHDF